MAQAQVFLGSLLATVLASEQMALSSFQILRRRIAAVRFSLEAFDKGTELHELNSDLQCMASLKMMKDINLKQLSDDNKATSSSLVSRVGLREDHVLAITGKLRTAAQKNRRDGQRFEAFPYYVSEDERKGMLKNVDLALAITVKVVVKRLNGVNVCENLKKRMLSCILICGYGQNAISMDSKLKAAIKTRFVKTYEKIRRGKRNEQKQNPCRGFTKKS